MQSASCCCCCRCLRLRRSWCRRHCRCYRRRRRRRLRHCYWRHLRRRPCCCLFSSSSSFLLIFSIRTWISLPLPLLCILISSSLSFPSNFADRFSLSPSSVRLYDMVTNRAKPSRQVEFPDLPVLQTSRTLESWRDKWWQCSWHIYFYAVRGNSVICKGTELERKIFHIRNAFTF
jgi:hypothetical protein